MSLPTFSIDASTIGQRFGRQSFTDQASRVDRMVQQASGELDIVLRQVGYSCALASTDTASRIYQLCQRFVEAAVIADLARSNTLADPAPAKYWDGERQRIEQRIRSHAESLHDSWSSDTHKGSFRRNKVDGAAYDQTPQGVRSGGRRRGFWRRGRDI